MTAESRRGKEFSKNERKNAKKKADYCCQGCGRKVAEGTEHSHEGLQIHHDPPIARGGGRHSKLWVLDAECHKVADRLALERGVSLTQVREKLGDKPLEPYTRNMRRGRWGKVVRRVSQRVAKVG